MSITFSWYAYKESYYVCIRNLSLISIPHGCQTVKEVNECMICKVNF